MSQISIGFGDVYEGQAANSQNSAIGVKEGSPTSTTASGVNSVQPENVIGAWLVVAGVFVALTLVLQRFSAEQTFSHVKLGFYNMLVIGFYALLFLTLGKAVAPYMPKPIKALLLAA